MGYRGLGWASIAFLIGLLAPGCGTTTTPVSTLDTGYLTLEWTLSGTKEEAQCTARGAAAVELNVYDSRSFYLGAVSAPCHHFLESVELREGSYKLIVRLIDNDHATVGEMQRIDTVAVEPNAEVTTIIDFPGDVAAAPAP